MGGVDGETNYCRGFKLLVEVFLDCKESVYGVIEDIDKVYERYLSIQMDFVLTAKMYYYFFISYFLQYTGGLYTSTINAN